jgi:acyl-CoA synthetase (AMP-forming)/AMP-acid ligase II
MTTNTLTPSCVEMVRTALATFPERLAAVDENRELTYRELETRATRIAHGLLQLGGRPGDRVLLLAHNCCEWVEMDVALMLSGLARIGVTPRLHPSEIAQIAADAEPHTIVVDGEWLATAGETWIPASTKHIVVTGQALDGRMTLDDLAASGTDDPLPSVDPEGIGWLIYSSGSTGLPKGVVLTPRNIGAMVRNIREEMPQVGQDDIAVHSAPLAHFSGAIVHALFTVGAANLLQNKFNVGTMIDTVQRGGATVLPLVPTQITMITEELERRVAAGDTADLSHVKVVLYAGSAIAPDRLAVARALFGNVMLQFYGASEAPMPITALQPDDHTAEHDEGGLPRMASAGRPNAHVDVKIAGPDGAQLPAGEVGRIMVRGDSVTQGYWRRPEETAAVLDAEGWLRTGDLGYLDSAGFLFIVDREKDMVVTGGFNVYPREVENVISSLPGIREVAVVGGPSDQWGEELIAIVSRTPGADVTAEDIIERCRERLARYKVPKQVRIVEELPKGGTGKILKRVVKEELWAGRQRRV